jgi:Tol biopolymer transport system component
MTLSTPSHFGPYEVVGMLGAGGVGEVYRARDSRLNREVALKVLASPSAGDATRQQRLLDEARAASALNHPNILAVYDVGAEHGVTFIVSELVDGTSLRETILRGSVSIRELLDLAVQIADGLAAAHDAGIVHRDLKPENVMVARDGRVKLVDFGLARMLEPEPGACLTSLPSTRTEAALIVGTVPYMSPEQARGVMVDFRSDQFSFGLILYELATGRAPFTRETPVETLACIISDEPRPIADVKPKVPVPLRWIIERCLAKDPRQRYAATADLAHDLRTLRDRLAETVSGPTVAAAPRRRRGSIAVGLLALGLLCLVLGARALVQWGAPDLSAYRFTPFAAESAYQEAPAWSPDGRTIAYVADVDGILQVFARSLGSSMPAQITQARFNCQDPFWSPDGTRIFYISLARDKESLWSVSAAGGAPEVVIENASYAAISPDGKTLAFFREEFSQTPLNYELWLSSPIGTEPWRFGRPPFADTRYSYPFLHFSPDGSKIGIWAWTQRANAIQQTSGRAFWVVPMTSEDPYYVLSSLADRRSGVTPFSWLPDNRHIVSAEVDARTPGTHLWISDTQSERIWPITADTSEESFPAVSPDGRTIAFASQKADFDLYEIETDGSPARVLLATSRNETDPVWSPTSSRFAFVTDRTGSSQIWLRTRKGDWEQSLVTEREFAGSALQLFDAPAFSPDGQQLAYHRFGPDGNKIWISRVAGGPPVRLTSVDGREEGPSWSPDGVWIAYTYFLRGRWSLAKARVGRTAEPPVVIGEDVAPGSRPQWSPTGEWIAYETAEGLSLISPDSKSAHLLSEQTWVAYGWAGDGSRLFGIRKNDDGRDLMLTSIDLRNGEEKIVTPKLGPMPAADQPVRGFTRVSNKSFATSIVRITSDIWLLEGFRSMVSLFDRLWPKKPGTRHGEP